jgi:hypothetical protein
MGPDLAFRLIRRRHEAWRNNRGIKTVAELVGAVFDQDMDAIRTLRLTRRLRHQRVS